ARPRARHVRRGLRASARNRGDPEPVAVRVRLDEGPECRTEAIDELLERAARRSDDSGHSAVVRKESLAHLDARRLRNAVAVRNAAGAVERGVGAVQRDAVLTKPLVLLLDEIEI